MLASFPLIAIARFRSSAVTVGLMLAGAVSSGSGLTVIYFHPFLKRVQRFSYLRAQTIIIDASEAQQVIACHKTFDLNGIQRVRPLILDMLLPCAAWRAGDARSQQQTLESIR